MIERDFEGKKQMPQVATTLTKDVLLSVVGKKDHILNFFFKLKMQVTIFNSTVRNSKPARKIFFFKNILIFYLTDIKPCCTHT
jgi:hypothetical protein